MAESPKIEEKRNGAAGFFTRCKDFWGRFKKKHPTLAQFAVFFVISNGVTVFQLALMPLLRVAFDGTALVYTNFQVFPVGYLAGEPHFIFNFPAGTIAEGGAGGLAYFLAVQITIGIAQVVNFFAQRKITFKANNSVARAAMWYVAAYIAITFIAAAALGLYRDPLYRLFMGWWPIAGETVADVVTMVINAAISFWVFFPIFKLIFKNKTAGVKR